MDLREIPEHDFARHPWEVARARFFQDLLVSRLSGRGPVSVLDVGAGDAYFARGLLVALPAGSEVVCLDANYAEPDLVRLGQTAPAGLAFCRERPPRAFDALVLLDVLEHVADDTGFLGDLVRTALAPGGTALISVPAFGWLYTRHDRVLGHHRRYRPALLRERVAAAGLRIQAKGNLFHSLLLPRAVAKVGERLRGQRSVPSPDGPADHADTELGTWRSGPALTGLVTAALRADNQLSRWGARLGLDLPGLSTWVLGSRP